MEVPASEFYDDYPEFMMVMDIQPMSGSPDTQLLPAFGKSLPIDAEMTRATEIVPQAVLTEKKDNRRYKLVPSGKRRLRPTVTTEDKECLATWVKVGDLQAWTLWDSGSTTTGITPAFAELAKVKVDTLEDPHVLQLGTVGSRSIIKYGADVSILMADTAITTYVDIANFDRYDMIIGTPLMRRNKVRLDFENNQIVVNGKIIPALKVTGEAQGPRVYRHRATDKKNKME